MGLRSAMSALSGRALTPLLVWGLVFVIAWSVPLSALGSAAVGVDAVKLSAGPVSGESITVPVGTDVSVDLLVSLTAVDEPPPPPKPVYVVAYFYATWYWQGWWTSDTPWGFRHVWRNSDGTSASSRPTDPETGVPYNPDGAPVRPLFEPYYEYGGWNPAAVRWSVEQARRAGVNVFAIPVRGTPWYAPDEPADYLTVARTLNEEGFTFCWFGDVNYASALPQLIRETMDWENYWHIEGKPVFVNTFSDIVSLGGLESELGTDFYYISRNEAEADVYSEFALTGWCWQEDLDLVDSKFRQWSESGRMWAPVVCPQEVRLGRTQYFSADHYRRWWEIAMRYDQNNPSAQIFFINTWDEVYETTCMFPNNVNGYEIVDLTREIVLGIPPEPSGPTPEPSEPPSEPAPSGPTTIPTAPPMPDYMKGVPAREVLPSHPDPAYNQWLDAVGPIGAVDSADIAWLGALDIDFWYYVNQYIQAHPPPLSVLARLGVLPEGYTLAGELGAELVDQNGDVLARLSREVELTVHGWVPMGSFGADLLGEYALVVRWNGDKIYEVPSALIVESEGDPHPKPPPEDGWVPPPPSLLDALLSNRLLVSFALASAASFVSAAATGAVGYGRRR